jgi:hypothetical protein
MANCEHKQVLILGKDMQVVYKGHFIWANKVRCSECNEVSLQPIYPTRKRVFGEVMKDEKDPNATKLLKI